MSRVHVIKPRIGGGFGGKQEMLLEDICGALALATRRPVKIEYTREEEFYMARSRHPQILRMKMGVKRDGTIVANQMTVLATTGAYGSHSTTVQGNTGSKVLPLYRAPQHAVRLPRGLHQRAGGRARSAATAARRASSRRKRWWTRSRTSWAWTRIELPAART